MASNKINIEIDMFEAIEYLEQLQIIIDDKRTIKDYVFTNCNECINKVDNKFTEVCFGCKRYFGCRFMKKSN